VDNRAVAGRVSSPDVVGRAAELADLDAALSRAAGGASSLVLVGGDSGVGKSRLVEELIARAAAAGMRTMTGQCVELSEGEIPFAPVVSALRRLAREMDEDDFAAVLGPARQELTRLFPELESSSEAAPEVLTLGSIGQARLFELLLGVLERLGSESPVLLVIEDLHWADRSTRDLLLFLARSIREERVLIVVTYRSDELHRRHPLRPFLVQIDAAPTVERIQLNPLSREEAAQQLERIIGERPSASTVDAIYERSEGNPFFTEELLAARTEDEECAGLPETLRDTLLLRVETLSPVAQEVLRAVAAAGRRAQHGLLVEVLELPEADLLAGLREAVGRYVLVEADDEASYEFRHALLREAVYEDLLPGERGKLHIALAQALERDPALGGQGMSVAAELAFHWYAAHELEPALRASVDAGMAAEHMYAFAEAHRHYERALMLWDRVPDAADRGMDQVELLGRAADASHHAGDSERAAALIRAALEQLDPETDPKRVSRALERLGRYLWISGHGEEAVPVYHRAVEVLPPEPSAELAHALAAEGQVLALSDRPVEAKALCDEALPIARAAAARRTEANILNTLVACAGSSIGDLEGAMDSMRMALAIAEELHLPDELMRSYVNGSDALHQAGRTQESLDLALQGAEAARRHGMEGHSGHFLHAEAAVRLMSLGRWDESLAESEAVLAASMQPLAGLLAREAQSLIACERGDFAKARAMVERSRAAVEQQGSSMWVPLPAVPLALIALREGRPEEARAIVERALAHLVRGEYVFFTRALYAIGARAEADIAETARPLRDDAVLAECERRTVALLERIDGLLAEYTDHPPPPAAVASRAAVVAELSRVRGASDAAAWDDAAARFDDLGEIHEAAYMRFRQAEALVRVGGSQELAASVLASGREVAARLGMAPLIEDIEALARRARLRLPVAAANGGTEATAPAPDRAAELGLTERELEVLALVAQGMTNRQIGAELFMSQKTASVHVSRILAKLGVANRAEAAASAQRLGLVGSP